MSGAVRCVWATKPRYHGPSPQTKFVLSTACSASYAAASARPQTSADWLAPAVVHCGLTKYGWLHSFMTTYWCTVGNVRATCAVHAANRAMRTVSPHWSGFAAD